MDTPIGWRWRGPAALLLLAFFAFPLLADPATWARTLAASWSTAPSAALFVLAIATPVIAAALALLTDRPRPLLAAAALGLLVPIAAAVLRVWVPASLYVSPALPLAPPAVVVMLATFCIATALATRPAARSPMRTAARGLGWAALAAYPTLLAVRALLAPGDARGFLASDLLRLVSPWYGLLLLWIAALSRRPARA